MKEWYWIVSWCIVSLVSTPCPEKPHKNKFGVTENPGYSCAVYHYKQVWDCDHYQYFDNKDSATAFFNEAKTQNGLDSVKLEKVKYLNVKLLNK